MIYKKKAKVQLFIERQALLQILIPSKLFIYFLTKNASKHYGQPGPRSPPHTGHTVFSKRWNQLYCLKQRFRSSFPQRAATLYNSAPLDNRWQHPGHSHGLNVEKNIYCSLYLPLSFCTVLSVCSGCTQEAIVRIITYRNHCMVYLFL